jgi:hypothetical protein
MPNALVSLPESCFRKSWPAILTTERRFSTIALTCLALCSPTQAQSNLFISEIMYHPVELPAFDTNGAPLLDLSDDVHEFVELYNAGPASVSLDGWRLTGGITFAFPAGRTIGAGGFVVVAKNPVRLAAIPQYGLTTNQILGPYAGRLANEGDTVGLRNARGEVVDSVSYSASFPWAIGADALGAGGEWTGLDSSNYQYRGRSLERVSYTRPANDPANWLASPLATGPTPGRTNSVQLPIPRPMVVALSVAQAADGAVLIRSNQPVRVEATFSATNQLSTVSVESFIENIDVTNETRSVVAMSPVGDPAAARFAATLPGQANRKVVRYRIRADRGAGVEATSPRPDDPFAWHAYFVTPQRTSANPIYDVFISTASLSALATNISQGPRRVTLPDPPGLPRPSWNATQPAILVADGFVYDIQMRYHGSRYRRDPSRKSYKYQFPSYAAFNGRTSYFEADKGEEHRLASIIYAAADLPMWRSRYIDIYQNSDPLLTRLEQEEMEKDLDQRWSQEQAAKYPDRPAPGPGGFYKSEGVVPYETATGQSGTSIYTNSGEGPYYIGNCAPIPPKTGWTLPARYDWTYPIQMHDWKAGQEMWQMIAALWEARGDSPTAPGANLAALRTFLEANFDVDATLTYIAIRNWSAPFDDATQNHFLWRNSEGRWGLLPWDVDNEFVNSGQSIYWDEQTMPQPDTLRGPQWVKDSLLKAYRQEYRQKLFILNHTLLTPANLTAIGAGGLAGYAAARQANVDQQLALGAWYAPLQPTNLAPAHGSAAFPGASLVVSAYAHSEPRVPPPASTTWILRSAAGTYAAPILRLTSPTNLTSWPVPFDRLVFGRTYFWKCLFTDSNGHPSPESVETSFVFGGSGLAGGVLLNEVLAENHRSVTNGGQSPDYVELVNPTDQAQDLTAFSLTDSPLEPGKYFFPAGSSLPAHGYLVVWADDATNAPGLHTGFAINKDGQTVALFAATTNGYALADSVSLGLQIPDFSVGRVGGAWMLTVPTPNAGNVAADLGSPASLKVNEWMATTSGGPDWFELSSADPRPVALGGLYLSTSLNAVTNTRIPALSFIAPRGFTRFIADHDPGQGARHANFRLSASGDSIVLSGTNLALLDAVTFGPQTTDISQGRLLDGSTHIVSFPGSASPEAPNYVPLEGVVISEVLSHTEPPLEDAIELLNEGEALVDISGWWLSDSLADLWKFSIPPGTVLSPGDFAVFTQSQFGDTNSPTAFGLSGAHGDELYLSAADAAGHPTGARASVAFGAAPSGVSFGRVPTSAGVDFWAQVSPTLSGPNRGARVGPVTISEIQYHPPPLPGNDDDYEYIRVQNITAAPVPLFDPACPTNTWRLRDAVDFVFPTNVTLPASGSLLLVGFDPATNLTMLTDFRSLYGLDEMVVILGPYGGRLNNAGENIELVRPDSPVSAAGPDFGFVPYFLADRVAYWTGAPWPSGADGTGFSLHRLDPAGYGNEPTNWVAGPSVVSNVRPTARILSPTNGSVWGMGQPFTIVAQASDSDGTVQRIEFFVNDLKWGQADAEPFSLSWSNTAPGLYKLVARAVDNRLGMGDSEPVYVSVVNQPPVVSLGSPANGAAFHLPTNIVLEASAADPDGAVVRVDFYSDGLFLDSAMTPPYRLVWTNASSGSHNLTAAATDNLGVISVSDPVTITNTRDFYIAYDVMAGTVGTQNFGNGLGMDFDVLSPILVRQLGVFDSGSDGINGSTTLTAQLYTRSANTGRLLATLTFTAASPGELVDGSRFKSLSPPVLLNAGSYTIVSYGHDSANPNGNIGTGNAKTWNTDDGGGFLQFVGTSRHDGSPGTFPPAPDGGPADRYAAGTFDYLAAPAKPMILAQPTNQLVRPGQTAAFTVTAAGQAPLFLQWFFNGSLLPGRTNASLQLTNAPGDAEGSYSVVVSNALGSVSSDPARLILLIDPLIVQQPLSQSVVAGETVTLSVAVTNTATLPLGYRWRRNAGNFTGNSFLLNERTCFITITNVQLPYTNYMVVVSNAARSSLLSSNAYLTFVADSDADGVPDAWESRYGLNPANAADAVEDTDGDGMFNWQEYVAGTDPTDPHSYLKVEAGLAHGGAVVVLGAVSNRTYTIQYRDAVAEGGWLRLADVVARLTNHTEVTADPGFRTNRFYRVVTPWQP